MKRVIPFLLLIFGMTPISSGNPIKNPNVAGQFYSDNSLALSEHVDAFLNSAEVNPSSENIQMIISPHAGYVYSGGVAAYGFKSVSRKSYKTIVILAPSHFFSFDGVSVWQKGGMKTPLGVVPVDEDFTQKIIDQNDKFYYKPEVFEREHSLEVQIPFLQKVFKDFKIVPIIMGQPTFELCEKLATTLNTIIGERDDVLVVVSTDMSHYHNDDFARKMDMHTINAIKAVNPQQIWKECKIGTMEMCGYVPITTALLLAAQRDLSVKFLKYANSGDVSGDRDRVVGYTAFELYANDKNNDHLSDVKGVAPLSLDQKRRLVKIARESVDTFVRTGKTPEFEESDPRLLALEGAFVTIHKNGKLRGCIGHIIGQAPLYKTVRDVAVAAASNDPRFQPVDEKELKDIDVEVSVLSIPERVKDPQIIEAGVHGVIVRRGAGHQGVFLPQVATEWGWGREQFLSNLCVHKAGLPADAWKDPKTELHIFTADVFSEEDVKEE